MSQALIEKLARTLCKAAKVDPDQLVEPDFIAPGYSSVGPSNDRVPAWHRFKSAAENVYGMRGELMSKLKDR